MFKWYRTATNILRDESEIWLSYLQGQKLMRTPHLVDQRTPYSNFPLQFFKYFASLLKNLDKSPWKSMRKFEKCDYYAFAGTSNQINSLHPTIEALEYNNQKVIRDTTETLTSDLKGKGYLPIKLRFSDVTKSIFLTLTRSPKLYSDLRTLHPNTVKYSFSEFCTTYTYLIYFERILTKNKATCIITSNDHSIPNRCLLAVAHELGIKTVYLQHASVSNMFPALRVNYAFLDGKSALDIYKQCEANQPDTNRSVPKPKIFLTGQKKPINKASENVSLTMQNIGFAFNILDNIEDVLRTSKQLLSLNKQIIIRWHPRQSKDDIKHLKQYLNKTPNVFFSDPSVERVDKFLSKITWIVSGNSSIHLEAALAGVLPIYYEISSTNNPDYYGYVAAGISLKANDCDDIRNLIENESLSNKSRDLAIRYYSSTYNTQWEGNEGALVAKCLIALNKGHSTPIDPLQL